MSGAAPDPLDQIEAVIDGWRENDWMPTFRDDGFPELLLTLVEIARAARDAEDLWNERMLGATVVIPERDDPDPLTQAWYRLNDALARVRP